VGVGIGKVMRPEDVLVPSFREQALQLLRGVTATELLLYWGGDERGSDFQVPREDFPVSVTVGGHAPHAVGVAKAFKLRRQARVAVCVLGDGATSKGDFYEAMNLAGVWRVPVVFVVTNNQWAISTPRSEQTAAATLAQKSEAAGFAGEQVDGNDVIAVAHCVGAAIERARSGRGPALVECVTYRMGDHTTVDDASRYRDAAEVERWREKDPLLRLQRYLQRQHGWTEADQQQLTDSCNRHLEEAIELYLKMPAQPPQSIFDFLFASLPEDLQLQRAQLLERGAGTTSG
jgi:pyruvate dehydrogenase E1 component alpha subunit